LRIVHVCQPTTGGTAVLVRQLAQSGRKAGQDIAIACPDDGELHHWAAEVGVEWIPLVLARDPALRDLGTARQIRKLMLAADVVHLHSSKAGALGRLATLGLRSRPRVVFTPHAWSWYVGGQMDRVYQRFERWAARRADIIVLVSEQELIDGRHVLGPRAPLVLIENGVDTDDFSPIGPDAPRSDAPLIVSVGRLSHQKGHDRAIRALGSLTHRDVVLRIVGDGPDEESLRELVTTLDLQDRVEFIGAADPRPHLRASDIVLLTSRWEGMSLVLLESMSVGCAIVATRCGGTNILDGVGRTVENHETDDALVVDRLRGVLDPLLDNPTKRDELGAAARTRVLEQFSIERVIASYASVWDPSSPN
jgi:glycosyltransferase involved in cell wall biosynthesis